MDKIIITRAMCFRQPSGDVIELTEGLVRDSYTSQRICGHRIVEALFGQNKKSATKTFDLWVKFERKIGSKQL